MSLISKASEPTPAMNDCAGVPALSTACVIVLFAVLPKVVQEDIQNAKIIAVIPNAYQKAA